ncbi:MAG: GDP-fucose synthetase [Actinobacteria bacterium RBG_16_64_13]|nr:MAG: GDP-fucose synthetase [Actinobacteria bacterium RBG_16_64_13]
MATTPDQQGRRSRIFLAGHTGLVGGAILRALQDHGYEDLVLRTIDEVDLTDQARTRTFFAEEQPQVVILAAARVGGIMANWEQPYEFIQENLGIELNVIHEAFRAGVRRLIFLGSSCIYPREAPQPLKEEYLLTGPLEETNRPYAIAKIAGIELCRSLNREYGTSYLSLMPTNMYGPGDNFDLETSHLVPALIRKFHEAKMTATAPVTLWGTGRPRRELLHVDDLAAAISMLLEGEGWSDIPDGLVNIGTGTDATIAELAETVRKVVGYGGPIVWDTGKPDGTPQKLLDVSRARALGWEPRIGLEEGLKRTYDWYCGTVPEGERRT